MGVEILDGISGWALGTWQYFRLKPNLDPPVGPGLDSIEMRASKRVREGSREREFTKKQRETVGRMAESKRSGEVSPCLESIDHVAVEYNALVSGPGTVHG